MPWLTFSFDIIILFCIASHLLSFQSTLGTILKINFLKHNSLAKLLISFTLTPNPTPQEEDYSNSRLSLSVYTDGPQLTIVQFKYFLTIQCWIFSQAGDMKSHSLLRCWAVTEPQLSGNLGS